MFETTVTFLNELRQSFRFVDAVDILLVSAFLYAALDWFQRTTSRGVLIGMAALAVVYFAARSLDMYLTSLAFHTTFAVLLFGLVVVFQEDLRRLLERVAHFRSFRLHKRKRRARVDFDALAKSVFKMAANKTGALIVIKAKEPLTRHLHGGIPLNGQFSIALLFSIFDSSTPGHDGAVVIEGNSITQFAAHLPISHDTIAVAGLGTRHCAAIGLSERSDALTIVVSEERGVVSIAESGKLEVIPSAETLVQRLDDFQHSALPEASVSFWNRVFVRHARLKMLSLLIAMIAWFALAYDPHTVQRTFAFPIEYRNLAKSLMINQGAPMESRVTLSGSDRDFRFLDPAAVKITLDLSDSTAGYQEIPLSAKNIRLPANLTPYRIDPRTIRLWLSPVDDPLALPGK
jgi:uncharacterized protein (TIGR00159 family)